MISTSRHPLHDVAVVGVGLTEQAKRHDRTTLSLCLEAAEAALADAGLAPADVDGLVGRWPGPGGTVFHPGSVDWTGVLGISVRWVQDTYPQGVPALLDAAAAIAAGLCHTVLIVGGQAGGLGRDAGKVADYTRPDNEFTMPWGAFTTAHFALVAKRYLHRHPQAREAMALAAATVRNHGHRNPDAVMHGRGPYTAADVLAAPPVADPFTLLDLCLTTEGAAAVVVTSLQRARDLAQPAVQVLGGGSEWHRQQYVDPPREGDVGRIGADASRRTWTMSGLSAADVDVAELYDINSFELLRQLEVVGVCGEGESASYVMDRGIGMDSPLPVNTDGGLLSFSHIGWGGPTLKIVQAVRQLRGQAGAQQVPDAEVALVTGAGSGAQYHNVLLLGRAR